MLFWCCLSFTCSECIVANTHTCGLHPDLACPPAPPAAAYGAEKAKMNALMEAPDGELHLTGHTEVTAQAMVIG